MKTREKVELGLLSVAVGTIGVTGGFLPVRMGTGELIAIGCLTWLVQGGVRDLWMLYLLKTRPATAPKRKLACMCLESTAGMTGLIIGLLLVASGLGGEVALTPLRWTLLVGAVFAVGFLAKDLVISWRPLGVRRDPEHHSIIFTWR